MDGALTSPRLSTKKVISSAKITKVCLTRRKSRSDICRPFEILIHSQQILLTDLILLSKLADQVSYCWTSDLIGIFTKSRFLVHDNFRTFVTGSLKIKHS